ncbi:hypothetical protein IQ255_29350 [Pleurocapsales cyanobacterium LEGE 10410]|nr:hypothetical protein [Pleurocapsales cyanobacterium LEGE 10410]
MINKSSLKNFIKNGIVVLLIGIISFLLSNLILKKYFYSEDDYFTTQITDFKGGDYFQLVYIGSEYCGFCSDSLHSIVSEIRNEISTQIKVTDYKFYSTGISIDRDPKIGFEFLNKSGPYDEMIIGAGWYNSGLIDYVWHTGAKPFTPQIYIVKKTFFTESAYSNILIIDRDMEVYERLYSIKEAQ